MPLIEMQMIEELIATEHAMTDFGADEDVWFLQDDDWTNDDMSNLDEGMLQ